MRGVRIPLVKSVTLIPKRWDTFWAASIFQREGGEEKKVLIKLENKSLCPASSEKKAVVVTEPAPPGQLPREPSPSTRRAQHGGTRPNLGPALVPLHTLSLICQV